MILICCRVAMGFDEGAVMIKIGREEPVASMDAAGKIIWARHNDIQTVNIRALGADAEEVCPSIGLKRGA
jgi:coatomer subunit beta'